MSETQYRKYVQQISLQDTDDEGDVCIGKLWEQKVYLHWSDVKDICTNAVSEAYEQVKKENEQLKSKLQLKETAYDFDTARLEEENTKLKKQVNHLSKTQAKQFRDNQKLQVKTEHAKDVVNIDTARQIKQLKELLKECREHLKYIVICPQNKKIVEKLDQVLGEE